MVGLEIIIETSHFLQTVFDDLKLMTNVIEELAHEAENEPETSIENIRALNDIKIQHEQMLNQFQVKTIPQIFSFSLIIIYRNKHKIPI